MSNSIGLLKDFQFFQDFISILLMNFIRMIKVEQKQSVILTNLAIYNIDFIYIH